MPLLYYDLIGKFYLANDDMSRNLAKLLLDNHFHYSGATLIYC